MSNAPRPSIIELEANFAKFEQAIGEKFMPALARAIDEVTAKFIDENFPKFISVEEASE